MFTGLTRAGALVGSRSTARNVGLVALAAALIAAAAQVSVPLGVVPVTGQTLAVLLVAGMLGRRKGVASVATYLLAGLAGAPVFAGGTFGPMALLGPTGGYLVGFLPAAWVTGELVERFGRRSIVGCLLALLAGEVAIFALGLAWLGRFVPADSLLMVGLWPFLPGEAVKLGLALPALTRRRRPGREMTP